MQLFDELSEMLHGVFGDSKEKTVADIAKKANENPESIAGKIINYANENVAFADTIEQIVKDERKSNFEKQLAKNKEIEASMVSWDKQRREEIEAQVKKEFHFAAQGKGFIEACKKFGHTFVYTMGSSVEGYENEGDKTFFNLKNPKGWRGDCNDFVAEFAKNAKNEGVISKEAYHIIEQGRAGTLKGAGKHGAWGAAGIAYAAEQLNKNSPHGEILKGKEVNADNLKAGMVMYYSSTQDRVKDRYGKIGHIVVITEHNGKKYVEEMGGKVSDYKKTELNDWLAKHKNKPNLTATHLDPEAEVRHNKIVEQEVAKRVKNDPEREVVLASLGYSREVQNMAQFDKTQIADDHIEYDKIGMLPMPNENEEKRNFDMRFTV